MLNATMITTTVTYLLLHMQNFLHYFQFLPIEANTARTSNMRYILKEPTGLHYTSVLKCHSDALYAMQIYGMPSFEQKLEGVK